MCTGFGWEMALVSLVENSLKWLVCGLWARKWWVMSCKGWFAPLFTQNAWTALILALDLPRSLSPRLCPGRLTAKDHSVSPFPLWLADGFNQWGATAGMGGGEESEVGVFVPHPLSHVVCAGRRWLLAKGAWFLPSSPFHIAWSGPSCSHHLLLGSSLRGGNGSRLSPGTILGCCIIHLKLMFLLNLFQITPFECSVSELSLLRLRLNSHNIKLTSIKSLMIIQWQWWIDSRD